MRQRVAEPGRHPAAIEITATHDGLFADDPAAAVEEFASWGVYRVAFPAFRIGRGDVSEGCEVWVAKKLNPTAGAPY